MKKQQKYKPCKNLGLTKEDIGTLRLMFDHPNRFKSAFQALARFESKVRQGLCESPVAHTDETKINIGGKKHWLHRVSNARWILYYPHKDWGMDAFYDMGLLPDFKGVLCHDRWKPYFKRGRMHALCNTHNIKELTRAWEHDYQRWAVKMKAFLEALKVKVNDAGGALSAHKAKYYRVQYRKLIKYSEISILEPSRLLKNGKRNCSKKSDPQKLLDQLKKYEDQILMFMENKWVPFSMDLNENDVQTVQFLYKLSDKLQSNEGIKFDFRIPSYLSTCRKQGIKSNPALPFLVKGKLPDFKK